MYLSGFTTSARKAFINRSTQVYYSVLVVIMYLKVLLIAHILWFNLQNIRMYLTFGIPILTLVTTTKSKRNGKGKRTSIKSKSKPHCKSMFATQLDIEMIFTKDPRQKRDFAFSYLRWGGVETPTNVRQPVQ